jgi:hypothetical protein
MTILAHYHINIRECSADEVSDIIRRWLDRCNQLGRLNFSSNYMIKYNINSSERNGYLPISLEQLRVENTYLYTAVFLIDFRNSASSDIEIADEYMPTENT